MPDSLVDRLLARICPWQCVLCREPAYGMDLCPGCLNDLPWLGRCCQACGLPLPVAGARLCGACRNRSGAVDRCVAALIYEYPVDRLITSLKYQRRVAHARVLAELLAIRIHEALTENELQLPELLVVVPMHFLRRYRRVHNHAELIARWLQREFAIPASARVVRRVRNTPPQAGLSRAARSRNLRNAFRVRSDVAGRRVALIDDVVTTGTTMQELARQLKAAGAIEVQVWAVARSLV